MNEKKYSTLIPRFFALLIDSLLLAVLIYFESFLIVPEMPVSIVLIGIFLYSFCNHFYFIYLHAIYGQTLGKMLMKIEVLNIDENPITFKQSFLREFPWLTYTLLLTIWEFYQILSFGITEDFRDTNFDNIIIILICIWTIASIIIAVINVKGRAIHDYIAETVVIRSETKSN